MFKHGETDKGLGFVCTVWCRDGHRCQVEDSYLTGLPGPGFGCTDHFKGALLIWGDDTNQDMPLHDKQA